MKKRLLLAILAISLLVIGSSLLSRKVLSRYTTFSSRVLYDRTGEVLKITPNTQGLYSIPVAEIPETFKQALLAKEDRYFYYHPGINPLSIVRDVFSSLWRLRLSGSSTLTQQLVKILLGQESDRSISNKFFEALYALSLEAHTSKDDILAMYANVAYFGKQAQGLGEASRYYFNKKPEELTEQEAVSLVASLGNPSYRFPGTAENSMIADALEQTLNNAPQNSELGVAKAARNSSDAFEIQSFPLACQASCTLTIDKSLTTSLREILARNLTSPDFASAKNAAIVVIKEPENELLAVLGTPDPTAEVNGYQINMATEPRPIGSTIKPFIYLKAFEKGARPYSLVDDREYTYAIGTGFPIYPKNYDGKYRGLVTLHSALVNSLNVPAVKVLEYLTPKDLYSLLRGPFAFQSIQPLESYDLGIALGGLEMDLLTLTHYFTIFPNQGIIKPLRAVRGGGSSILATPMEAAPLLTQRVAPREYTELVTKIISDRNTAVDQFGLASNLNLPYKNYALKTGTSRDFHDSWTIGYTPDFVVGVWVGNHDNTAMHEVSGQSGAGKIWHEVMQLMYASEYNKNTPFSFSSLESYQIENNLEYGLPGDDVSLHRNELLRFDTALLLSPHEGDVFQFESGMVIPLKAKQSVNWSIDGLTLGTGAELSWKPKSAGTYLVGASASDKSEKISITLLP